MKKFQATSLGYQFTRRSRVTAAAVTLAVSGAFGIAPAYAAPNGAQVISADEALANFGLSRADLIAGLPTGAVPAVQPMPTSQVAAPLPVAVPAVLPDAAIFPMVATPDDAPVACTHDANGIVDPNSGEQAPFPDGSGDHVIVMSDSADGSDTATDGFTITGLVPGDCGQVTTTVINNGTRSGILRALLLPVTLTPAYESGNDAADQYYEELELSTGLGVSPGLAPTAVADLISGSDLMNQAVNLPASALSALPTALASSGALVGSPEPTAEGLVVGCMAIQASADFPLIIDFPYAPSKADAATVNASDPSTVQSGGNLLDADLPSVEFSLFFFINDAPDDQCDPPDLQVAVSNAAADNDTEMVTWTVAAQNPTGFGASMGTYAYLIVDGYHPEDWAGYIAAPTGTSFVCNVGGTTQVVNYNGTNYTVYGIGGTPTPANADGTCPGGGINYFTDPARPDKQLMIWDLGTMPGGDSESLTVSIPMKEVDSDGDVCVTVYIDSLDQPWAWGAGGTTDGHGVTRNYVLPASATFGATGGWLDSSNNPLYPGAQWYDYARHHWVPRPETPPTFDAGQLNYGVLANDTDGWDYNGWVPKAPNLQVDVSDYNAATDGSDLVSWTVSVQNLNLPQGQDELGFSLDTYVYLILDAEWKNLPTGWDSGAFNIPDGTALVCNVGGVPGPCGPDSLNYFPDQNNDDKILVIWQVGLPGGKPGKLPAGTGPIEMTVTLPFIAVTDDGDICVTAYVDASNQPYTLPTSAVDQWGNARDFSQINAILIGTAAPTFGGLPGSTAAAAWANYPGAKFFDYAMNNYADYHDVPHGWDAGQRNDGIDNDNDRWDYTGFLVPVVDNPPDYLCSGLTKNPPLATECLQVSVSPFSYNHGNVTWTVTARNGSALYANPVQVDLAVDACLPGRPAVKGCENPRSWVTLQQSKGAPPVISNGVYPDNQHVSWLIGMMAPGEEQTLVITIPAADVTWDGDICVTAVISSLLNLFTNRWTPSQISLYTNGDIDADGLKTGTNALQRNNAWRPAHPNVTDDIDQWDYNGWYPDNPRNCEPGGFGACLKISVSNYYEYHGQVYWKVWAKNAGTLSADPVTVDIVPDALTIAAWGNIDVSQGYCGTDPGCSMSDLSKGVYADNDHLTWNVGHLEPGQWEVMTLSVPTKDVTWDKDICITAVISSPLNPYTAVWTPAQISALRAGDIDADSLKFGGTINGATVRALQWNNSPYGNLSSLSDYGVHVDDDTDQWDYNGWRRAPGSLTRTGINLALAAVAVLALAGGRLMLQNRRKVTAED